jgi:5'(3')-deoxyribonucleotidase
VLTQINIFVSFEAEMKLLFVVYFPFLSPENTLLCIQSCFLKQFYFFVENISPKKHCLFNSDLVILFQAANLTFVDQWAKNRRTIRRKN